MCDHGTIFSALRVAALTTIALGCLISCACNNSQSSEPFVSGRLVESRGGKPCAGVVVHLRGQIGGQPMKTKTDDHGRFTFANVEPSVYWVWPEFRDGNAWPKQTIRVGLKPVRLGDVLVKGPQSISGIVRDKTSGKGVAGVRIAFSTKNNQDVVRTGADGRYRLYVDPIHTTIECEGDGRRWHPTGKLGEPSRKRFVPVAGGKHVSSVNFNVRSAPQIVGRLVGLSGKPVAGAELLIRFRLRKGPNRLAFEFGGSRFLANYVRAVNTKTDAKGRFRGYVYREDPTPDKTRWLDVTLIAKTKDGKVGAYEELALAHPSKMYTTGAVQLERLQSVRLRLIDNKGAPLVVAEPKMIGHQASGIPTRGSYSPPLRPKFRKLGGGVYRVDGLYPGTTYLFGAAAKGYEPNKAVTVKVEKGKTPKANAIKLVPVDKRATEQFIKLLKSKDRYQREHACWRLGELGADAAPAVDALRARLLGDRFNTVRFAAAQALGKIGVKAKKAVPDLIVAMQTDTDGVPEHAAVALGQIGDDDAVDALCQALTMNNFTLRTKAAKALGQIQAHPKKRVAALLKAVDDKRLHVSRAAVHSLGQSGKAAVAALPKLSKLALNGPRYLRPTAVEALGRIGQKESLPVLKKAMSDSDDIVFQSAVRAIRRIQGDLSKRE